VQVANSFSVDADGAPNGMVVEMAGLLVSIVIKRGFITGM
jgi:hypothetical protein